MRISSIADLAKAVEEAGCPVEIKGRSDSLLGPDVCIDSRQVTNGSIFVALKGERVDGHDYVRSAYEAGASLACVSYPVDCEIDQMVASSGDSLDLLAAIAHVTVEKERSRQMKTIAITGSSGKTTTKDLLAHILSGEGRTVAPIGSFNNEIGTPLTACEVDEQTRFLISEMGARGVGHIAHLCRIVTPDIAVVVNIGQAHVGEFGSVQMTAQAKGEIYEALDDDGWAVINADDEQVRSLASRTRGRIAQFSIGSCPPIDDRVEAIFGASDLEADDQARYRFIWTCPQGQWPISLLVSGRHQVSNALAAASCAYLAGVDPKKIAERLSTAHLNSSWRMDVHKCDNGTVIVNDAYNANPDSMKAAIETVASMKYAAKEHSLRLIAVLGDMLELGEQSSNAHRQIGKLCAQMGVDELITVGRYAADLCEGAVGEKAGMVAYQREKDEIIQAVNLRPGDIVVVKASRSMGLEQIAQALIEREAVR